jgi:glycosyltransferase involved in cell wall biosynthesis
VSAVSNNQVQPSPVEAAGAAPRLAIFTICSNNYLPLARVLLASAARHHPEAEIFLCLADEFRRDAMPAAYPENIAVVTLDQLAIEDVADFAFRYDILELNTAAKPFMFLYLTEQRDFDQVIYFDPDIEIFAPLESVIEAMGAGASLVLTPHICEPGELGESVKDIIFLVAGTYNLGFLAVRRCAESAGVLHWWSRRLRYDCVNEPSAGYFVDQKFMDLVPGFAAQCCISRDTTLNVAYWNITQRPIAMSDDGWLVNGRKLAFFHFSGVDPMDSSRLSRHGPTRPKAGTALRTLLEQYLAQVMANGYLHERHTVYGFGNFSSGVPIPLCVRKMYRTRYKIWSDNPFETFEEVLHLPDPDATSAARPYVVTNLMRFLFDALGAGRAGLDLRKAEDANELVRWYIEHGRTAYRLDWRLIAPVEQRITPRLPAAADVSVIGYLSAATGVGQAGRATLRNLGEVDELACEAIDIDGAPATGSGLVQIFHVNADQLPLVMTTMRPRLPRGAYRIAVPFWELETLPEPWRRAFDGVDEVWASSRFIQKTLEKHLKTPVIYLPLALTPIVPVPGGRAAFGLNDDFLFFTAFDFLSYVERKNPLAAIAAFQKALPETGAAGLVIKTQNSASDPEGLARLHAAIGDDARIKIIDMTLSQDQVVSLITACDCVVSLHRSEGLGLLVAEAMLLEKPVIATDYGATTELVTAETGFPVDYRLVPVAANAYPCAEGQIWAEPDIAHAAICMRQVISSPDDCRIRIRAARQHLNECYAPEKIRAMQLERFRAAGLRF